MFKRDATPMQNFNQTSFSLALIAMVLLTLGTVSISSAADQTATLSPRTLGDNWTTIAIVAGVSLAVAGISIVFIFIVRQRKLSLPSSPPA
jgi:cytochrome c biogenesis protein CcdA